MSKQDFKLEFLVDDVAEKAVVVGNAGMSDVDLHSGSLGVTFMEKPIATVQMTDANASCAMITAEIQANNIKVQELAGEEGAKVAQNVAAGVGGLLIPVLWFGMDFKGAASKEVAALQARQQYLTTLAVERCGKPRR